MKKEVDELLDDYESGRLSRRGFIAGMSALAALAGSTAQAQSGAPMQVTSINHVTLFVEDIPESVAFYQDLFGLQIKSEQEHGINLAIGDDGQFLGIYNGPPNVPEQIHHVCLGIRDFNPEQALSALRARGIEPQINMRGDTPEIYFPDPTGLLIQLQDESYCGGGGLLGNQGCSI